MNIVVGQRGGDSVEAKGGQSTNKTAAELGSSVEDNAGTGGGGGDGSFVYTSNNVLLLAAAGRGCASNGYNGWMVRRVLMGPKAKGKVRPKAEAEGLGDSRASAITQLPVTVEGLVRVGCHRVVLRQG